MARMANKMALVTGAAQGLGAAISHMLASEGAKVTLTDINEAGAAEAAARINADFGAGTAFSFGHDVTDEARWQEVLKAGHDAMGGLNVLVNNAGIGTIGSVEDETYEAFRKVQAVDVDSIFLGCKYAISLMRDHGMGSIVNISSIAGIIASHNYVSYNAAKAAVRHMSKSIADGVKQMFGEKEGLAKLARQVPLGRVGEPEDIAYAVLYLASDESKFVTGAELKVDGGISAL